MNTHAVRYIIFFISALTCRASGADGASGDARARLKSLLIIKPDAVWAPGPGDRLREARRAFAARARLGDGESYGHTARTYALQGRCAAQIERDMDRLKCRKKIDVIREPVRNEPVRDPRGNTAPIWQFVCTDGSVIKIKPNGDPSSRFVPYPHGSRTLRYPAETEYRDYRDEVAKVSEDGFIIPRGPTDLGSSDLVGAWSREAHVPLAPCD